MIRNLRQMRARRRQQIAFSYLHEMRSRYLREYPQMACLSFDHIGIVINVHGRMDDAFLTFLQHRYGDWLKDKAVLDIGANIGNHTLAFADMAKQVTAFEPQDTIHELCVLNARHADNVTVLKIGASDTRSKVTAAVRKDAYGSTRITEHASENETTIEFDVAPIDEIVDTAPLRIGLIKIDVEGHEPQALAGAAQTIRAHRPVVVIEQDVSVIENGSSSAIEILRGYGYDIFEPRNNAEQDATALPPLARSVRRKFKHLVSGYAEPRWDLHRLDRLEQKVYQWLVALPSEGLARQE